MFVHVGFDDTDSPKGGCTTYIAALYTEKLLQIGTEFVEYPTLLRLNPNTPWKTRGNASVCLRFKIKDVHIEKIKQPIIDLVDKYGELWCDNTNPGIVFLEGTVSQRLQDYSRKVVQQIVDLDEAEKIINTEGVSAIAYKNRRGLVGALAAIGGTLKGDHTYELLTYRDPSNWGTPRLIDEETVRLMDVKTRDSTYNNVDEEGRILITPHGPDPVLYGIRGESPEGVHEANSIIKSYEKIERWMIFRSNQGTDAHYSKKTNIQKIKPYNPVIVEGKVNGNPKTLMGGHVIFPLTDSTGSVDCAAYEPTGNFRKKIRELIKGDQVRVYAGVRPRKKSFTLNIEKLEILELVEQEILENPRCPLCTSSMESMGKEKGYRCRKCGFRDSSLTKISRKIQRNISSRLYIPDKNAQRHLTKPLERYGREKKYIKKPLITNWVSWST